jgi:DNA primase
MGTALTQPQLKTLSKFARRLILALDPDAAGAKATMRGLEVVRQASDQQHFFLESKRLMYESGKLSVEMRVMTLPDGQDPDDVIRERPAQWTEAVKNAQPVADYVIDTGAAALAPEATFAERENAARELLPILTATENDLQRQDNLQKLAYAFRLGTGRAMVEWAQQFVRQRVRAPLPAQTPGQGAPNVPDRTAAPQPRPKPPGAATEHYVMAALIRQPELLAGVNRRLREIATDVPRGSEMLGPLDVEDFAQTDYQIIFDTFARALSQVDHDLLSYLDQRLPSELRPLFERLLADGPKVFQESLTASLRIEFGSILTAQQTKNRASGAAAARSTDDEGLGGSLEQAVFALRKARLRRHSSELQFLRREADTHTDRAYGRQLTINQTAILRLEQAIRRR